ncbi:MAG TPA: DUF998 domain-containing protein [Nitrososphaerales archaeon]|nr:DUF998 domain-containing protein [Nitrososphaerales archaeon]
MTSPGGGSSSGDAGRARALKRAAWLVIALVLLYVVLDVVAQLLPPHYSPISQAESDLAVGPYGYVMAANFINRGVLSLLFLFALDRASSLAGAGPQRYRGGIMLLGVWAVGALLLAFFPTDVPPAPATWHGVMHLVVAVIAFLGGAFGSLVLSVRFARDPLLGGARRFAMPISVLAVLACLVTLFLPGAAPHLSSHIGGLTERVFLGLVLLWMLTMSAYLIRAVRNPSLRGSV